LQQQVHALRLQKAQVLQSRQAQLALHAAQEEVRQLQSELAALAVLPSQDLKPNKLDFGASLSSSRFSGAKDSNLGQLFSVAKPLPSKKKTIARRLIMQFQPFAGDGKIDVRRWCDDFLYGVQINDLEPWEAVKYLGASLQGTAALWLRTLQGWEQETSPQALLKALIQRFGESGRAVQVRRKALVRRRQQGAAESVASFAAELQNQAHLAELAEEEVLELFLTNLRKDIRQHVLSFGDFSTLEEAIKVAQQRESALQGDDSDSGASKQEVKRRVAAVAEVDSLAYLVTAAVTAALQRGGARKEPPGPCPLCGLTGHWKRECPKLKDAGPKGLCFTCGQAGHYKRDCPRRKKKAGDAAGADPSKPGADQGNAKAE
jgi:hypothetical protein